MLYAGGTVVIQRTFEPTETLRLLQEENITLFFGVPAVFLFLIQHPDFQARAFENIRLVMSGGAPLPVSLVKQYHRAGIVLQQGFGMSEAAPSIATLGKDRALRKAGSIGRALFHVESRIVDDDLKDLPTDAVGELVIRGPNLMRGYWNRPEATEEALAGGWFHTGDLARMDEEGDLSIVERKKDMFISGGENVYPAEVENVLFELSPVSEAAVIGFPMKNGERSAWPWWFSRRGNLWARRRSSITSGPAGQIQNSQASGLYRPLAPQCGRQGLEDRAPGRLKRICDNL